MSIICLWCCLKDSRIRERPAASARGILKISLFSLRQHIRSQARGPAKMEIRAA